MRRADRACLLVPRTAIFTTTSRAPTSCGRRQDFVFLKPAASQRAFRAHVSSTPSFRTHTWQKFHVAALCLGPRVLLDQALADHFFPSFTFSASWSRFSISMHMLGLQVQNRAPISIYAASVSRSAESPSQQPDQHQRRHNQKH